MKLLDLALIATANPFGFTVNAETLEPVTDGFAVAVKATQDSFGQEGLQKVIDYADANGIPAIGGWLNDENGKFYYDATIVVETYAEALALARENEQLAFFDLNACEEIRLDY